MVLLDTSAWIQFFKAKGFDGTKLQNVATCPPVIQEVLQGIRSGPEYELVELGLLALPCLSRTIELELYLEAASIYRVARRKGITVRSSRDCLIAAIALRHDVPLVHRDRDFVEIERFTALRTQEAQHFLL